jgi:hypothetical protein
MSNDEEKLCLNCSAVHEGEGAAIYIGFGSREAEY